jgi:hypothetical protein
MTRILDWVFFNIKYKLYIFFTKVFAKKSRRYIMFFVGKYPENFKHGLKPILDNEHQLKWIFGPASIILIFNSKEKMKHLDKFFKKMYSEYTESFFLFDITKEAYSRHVTDEYYKHLYSNDKPKRHNELTLNKIQYFVDLVSKAREQYIAMLNEEIKLANEEKDRVKNDTQISMDVIDPILDKIIEFGYESLTEEEKLILKRYKTENDNENESQE